MRPSTPTLIRSVISTCDGRRCARRCASALHQADVGHHQLVAVPNRPAGAWGVSTAHRRAPVPTARSRRAFMPSPSPRGYLPKERSAANRSLASPDRGLPAPAGQADQVRHRDVPLPQDVRTSGITVSASSTFEITTRSGRPPRVSVPDASKSRGDVLSPATTRCVRTPGTGRSRRREDAQAASSLAGERPAVSTSTGSWLPATPRRPRPESARPGTGADDVGVETQLLDRPDAVAVGGDEAEPARPCARGPARRSWRWSWSCRPRAVRRRPRPRASAASSPAASRCEARRQRLAKRPLRDVTATRRAGSRLDHRLGQVAVQARRHRAGPRGSSSTGPWRLASPRRAVRCPAQPIPAAVGRFPTPRRRSRRHLDFPPPSHPASPGRHHPRWRARARRGPSSSLAAQGLPEPLGCGIASDAWLSRARRLGATWTCGGHLVVRQHADLRQHPGEQPPQVRAQRRRAQKHRLCHGGLDGPGDAGGQSLGVGRVERQHGALLGPDDRPQQALLERRREADGRQLALVVLVLRGRWRGRGPAGRPRSSRRGPSIAAAASAIASRIVVEVANRHALAQQLPQHALDVAERHDLRHQVLDQLRATSGRPGRPSPWSAGGSAGRAGTSG